MSTSDSETDVEDVETHVGKIPINKWSSRKSFPKSTQLLFVLLLTLMIPIVDEELVQATRYWYPLPRVNNGMSVLWGAANKRAANSFVSIHWLSQAQFKEATSSEGKAAKGPYSNAK